MHEIVTIQLGQKANYVATHFWNTQESYHTYDGDSPSPIDHDIHFRAGISADGSETYLPRTLIYDLKGGFGSLRKINELYEIEGGTGDGVWNAGPQIPIQQAPIAPSAYHAALSSTGTAPQLDLADVRYWSDFAHTYYHPRSVVQLNDYTLHSSLQPFERYDAGDELFESLDQEHDILDRDLRPWAEECDRMQGLQVFTATHDAWAGFASRYLERIRDEYGKVPVWVWGIEEVEQKQAGKKVLQSVNTARSLYDISAQASLYIPLTLPIRLPDYVGLWRTAPWHVSALLSTAIETCTLSTKLRRDDGLRPHYLNDLELALNVNGNQRIARLQASVFDAGSSPNLPAIGRKPSERDDRVPGSGTAQTTLPPEDEEQQVRQLDLDFFPSGPPSPPRFHNLALKPAHTFGQIETYRAASNTLSNSARDEDDGDEDDSVARKRRRIAGLPVQINTKVPLDFSILPTFPPIFSFPADDASERVPAKSVAVRSCLSTTTAVSTRIKELREIVGRTVGVLEDREGLVNGLEEVGEQYREGWEDDGESDDE